MLTPILTTKLYIPLPRPKLIQRPRLAGRLNEGCPLTLISAPAGFGKTTLVSEWVTGSGRPVAWLSLDEGDNDLTRFLVYLVAALQTILPDIGAGASAALQSPQPPPTEMVLTALLNDINTVSEPFTLILDDYHVIDTPPVGQALTFLLEHQPPQFHFIIITREDPRIPLVRLRARGQLTELRTADLRFTRSEAAGFLTRVMDLDLSAEDIAALETRTEGWIAGLQLAALSLQGHHDTDGFIKSFTGSHRFVLDYLLEEVLQRQPEGVRKFLLQTSILQRLNVPLCNAVTGQIDGREMLETLDRGNLFVVPLDNERQWYRYHHLFADVLQTRLMEATPDQMSILHQRASEWCGQNGFTSDAVRHAFAARDLERTASLIELAWSAMDRNHQSATWLGWVKALPEEMIRARPVLCLGYAWALLDNGEMEASEARLRDAERWLADINLPPKDPSPGMVVMDEKLFQSLPALIATARAYRAMALDDLSGTMKHAELALRLTPAEDSLARTQAMALLGLTQYASGDLEAAERSLTDFYENMRKAGGITEALSITFILADIRVAMGRLRQAVSTYQQSLQLAARQGESAPLGAADLYRGLSEVYCEWGDLETAVQHLETSKKLGEQSALTDWQHRLCVAQARIREVQGDLDGALDLLNEAERLYIRNPLPDVRPIAALKARVWVRQGRLAEALAWVRQRGLSLEDEISYLREFEQITLVRVLLAWYDRDREIDTILGAKELLERLQQAAEKEGRMGSGIEILMLQALAHHARGNITPTLVALERALTLAEPEGFIRIFLNEGRPMAELLMKLEEKCGTPRVKEYTQKLLSSFRLQQKIHSQPVTRQGANLQTLIEPLSERELEVLKLLDTELNGPEIARELMVSLNTMRSHTKSIYDKLGVNNRRAAIRRAKELELL